MATVKFYLKSPKQSNSSLFFRINYGAFKIVNGKKQYLPLQYQIDKTINPTFWNSKKGEVKQVNKFPQYPEFNARLNNIRDTALTVLRKLKNDGIKLSNDILRKELDKVFKKHKDQTESNSDMELMTFIPHFINTVNRSTGTKSTYKLLLSNLLEYESSFKIKLTYDTIDIDFYNSFIQFLQSKQYTPNTIGGRIKMLKVFMNEAYERGLHVNLDFKKKAFTKPSEDTKNIYLNENELKQIYSLNLSKNSKLDKARDWFLIGAYTGLRFSDLQKLMKDNIKNNTLEIITKKTATNVVVPLHYIVKEILAKYSYQLPKVMSNQKFNDYIKDVCALAGIDEDILIEETKGVNKSKKTVKKYTLVSAHTARRSFATNAFIAGVPTLQIMKMTGHNTEKSFLLYIKISEQENAQKLQSHPFFNK